MRRLFQLVLVGVLCSYGAFAQIGEQLDSTKTSTKWDQARITISNTQGSAGTSQTVSIRFPHGSRPESLKAVLNGKDITIRFAQSACTDAVCFTAVLSDADGMRDGKNVLYATAKNEDGTASSSRLHFEGNQYQQKASLAARALPTNRAVSTSSVTPSLPTLSSFLPPAVAFNTLSKGGASPNTNWIQIGTQQQLATGTCGSEIYSVIVLDRQTLVQKVSAPENSPQCFSSGANLTAYLQALAATSPSLNDLVIVGTNLGANTDAGSALQAFSTYWIGGRTYNCGTSCTPTAGGIGTADIPNGYMAIGVLGAASGSAYENYTVGSDTSASAQATGMLIEDASGDYNFQSSGAVEYMVQPGQTASQTYIQINSMPGFPNVNLVYGPPSASSNASGFWLLVFDRNTLNTLPGCPQNPANNGVITIPNCGTFIATGGSQGSPSNISQLRAALNAVTSSQIVMLTTVGMAGWGPANVMAGTGESYGLDNGTYDLADALQVYGIPDKLILETGSSTFTMVGVPGLGGPLNGHNVLSTSYLSQQGQTGYVHGTLAKDNHGLYEPSRTQQEPGLNSASGTSTDNANLQLGVILSQQPVEWPELAGPLDGNGSGTLAGQIDAYKYLSWNLLNNYYFIGQITQSGQQYAVDPPYAYDIHYFFTGSLNTQIDIHTIDPLNIPYPSNSNGCSSCTWQGPDGTQLNFTISELSLVQAQLHNEIASLSNLLTYFVTGSTNLKNIVAAGNNNAALSLLQASSSVQANINEQGVALAQTTPVKVSPWHIVNMIAGAASPVVTFITGGEVNTANIRLADKAIGIIGDLYTAAASTGGGLSSGHQSSTDDIPRLDYSLDTTVGQLAGLALQNQFLAGFDATLDSITGDWNKLNALGSSVVANQVLFAPTQVTQNAAINQLTVAEQSSLYMSLIPSVFQMHFWNMTSGTPKIPDMGYSSSGNTNSCSTFYPGITKPATGTNAPRSAVAYPTYGGTSFQQYWSGGATGYPFQWSQNPQYQDWYVLSLPFLNQGHSNTNAQVMNVALANILFGNQPGQVNLPIDEFVSRFGPMDVPITGGTSRWIDFSNVIGLNPPYSPYTITNGISPGNICSQAELNDSVGTVVGTSPPASNTTVTTLTSPSSAVLGETVTLQAKVVVQATSAAAAGSIQFRDGSTVLQQSTLDSTGSASYTLNSLALGGHALSASFASADGSLPSDSGTQALTVYANSPDMQLSLSSTSLSVSYGTASPSVTLQVKAVSGMSGTVSYACSGLPVGMTCTFTPASGTVSDGGMTATSFTIKGAGVTPSSMVSRGLALSLLMPPLFLLGRLRRQSPLFAALIFPMLCLVFFLGSLVGCGGSGATNVVRDTGSKTVLVSATCGGLTKTTTLVVNVQ